MTTSSPLSTCCTPAAASSDPLAPPGERRVCPLVGLLLVLIAAIPPVMFDLGARDGGRVMENISLLSAQETWMRQHGADQIPAEPDAWLKPSSKGNIRLIKGPGLIWTYMLAWTGLEPDTSTAQQLVFRARIACAVLGVMMVLSVYWMGISLGSVVGGAIAAGIMASTWFFQRQVRTASYDIHLAAWAALSVAAGYWAIQPLTGEAPRWQRVTGWALSAAAMAMSWLAKNPLAILITAVPLAAAAALAPRHRVRHLVGVALMVAIAAAIVLPWQIWVARFAAGEATTQLTSEWAALRKDTTPFWYYIGVLGLMLPWTLYLIAGLVLPFAASRVIDRRAALVPWLGFVLLIVAFSLHNAKQQRYILPVIPFAALVAGMTWWNHHRAARSGQPDRGAGLLYWPQFIGMIVAGPLIAAAFHLGPRLVEWGWLEKFDLIALPLPQAIVLGIVLVITAAAALRMSLRHRVLEAAILAIAWTTAMTTVLWTLSDRAPEPDHIFIAAAEKVRPAIKGQPAYNFVMEPFDARQFADMEEFILYLRRIVPDLSLEELQAKRAEGKPFAIFSRATPEHEAAMRGAGFTWAMDVQVETKRAYQIWQFTP